MILRVNVSISQGRGLEVVLGMARGEEIEESIEMLTDIGIALVRDTDTHRAEVKGIEIVEIVQGETTIEVIKIAIAEIEIGIETEIKDQ